MLFTTLFYAITINTIRCEVISSSFKGNIRIFGYFDILGPNIVP